MSKLPRPTGKEIVSLLLRQGFSLVRVRGSHHVLEKEKLRTVIPVHRNNQLKIGTLRGILRDTEITPKHFKELRKK